MQLGMIGLGRMGANMVRRLMKAGIECIAYDVNHAAVDALVKDGAIGAKSLEELTGKFTGRRAIWMMVPAALVDETIEKIKPMLAEGDMLIDGGNSYYIDDIRRSKELAEKGIEYIDCGVSGGVFGLERGYCLMVGGPEDGVKFLDPVLRALAPGKASASPTPGREKVGGTAEEGYLHCGPSGAGHFVKMVHNGIEYGLMAAYAEGLNILEHANVGKKHHEKDAETTPLRNPEHYQYDFNMADITEVWRRGSVIASWLLDLAARALVESPKLEEFSGQVSDSGEGRWTVIAGIESSAPAPVLSTALYERFSSRGEDCFADKLLSALRFQFGGHKEKNASV